MHKLKGKKYNLVAIFIALQWLQNVFPPYLDEWEAYAHAQEHLSSLQGLLITGTLHIMD